MIKSKFDGYQRVVQTVVTAMLLALFYIFYLGYFGPWHVAFFSRSGILVFILAVVLPVYIIAQMKLNFKTTIIDTDNYTFTFKMFLLPISKTYPFGYFDGYVSTTIADKYSEYKCYYLVKDGKLMYKMSGRFYSNINELQKGFSDLKYLGSMQLTASLSVKIALGKPVYDAKMRVL